MSDQEFVLAIIAIGMGSVILIVGITKITGLIKSWMSGSSEVDEESFNRLAKAFMEHKKDTQRRIQNLEAIITDDSTERVQLKESQNQLEAPKQSIEFDDSDNTSEESESKTNNKNNLRNMLRE
jgi:lipopolysaccharide export LptBFGC system permease protein LptF